ncbi:hypothetical protein P4U87_16960 [Bacillus subtilis]|uniref:hypothetical protein n=1 Tax=Bacillus subtilis TaxID=1423 RepID=UPI00292DAC73|nr:hypothetical protein [Bacillus subtilis]MED1760613.1 hypothetical protein [Bacillus subtilis]
MLKLTEEQYNAFCTLLGIGNNDEVLEELYASHGSWEPDQNPQFAILNDLDRGKLAEAVIKGNFQRIPTPIENVDKLIESYSSRGERLSGNEKEIMQDIVTELKDLKEIIKLSESAE